MTTAYRDLPADDVDDLDTWPAWTKTTRYTTTRARTPQSPSGAVPAIEPTAHRVEPSEPLASPQSPPDAHRDFAAWVAFVAARFRATGDLPAILAAEALDVLASEASAVATPGRPLSVAEFLDRSGALESLDRAERAGEPDDEARLALRLADLA